MKVKDDLRQKLRGDRVIHVFIIFLLFFSSRASAQDFQTSFFEGNWVENIGFKGYVFPADTFDVMDYGAKNDGIFKSTEGIQKAIDACALAGGGVVRIPEGRYLIGSLFLKSGIHLLIDEGTTVLGSMDLGDYDYRMTRMNGIEMEWPMGIINVVDARNVKISGKGTIHGQGKPFWEKFWYMEKNYSEKGLRWVVMQECERPRMIVTQNASNVHISELTLRESAFWTVHILYSKQVTIDGVTIRNNDDDIHGPSTDGIDIDSSEDVLVQNSDIDCNDDNFCLKSGRDADGLRVNRPTRYVVLRNNIARAGAGLITFGSETSGGISHVYAHDMVADGNRNAIRFKSASVRGGYIKHILIEDIEIRNTHRVFAVEMNFNPKASYPELPDNYHYDSIPDAWKVLLQKVEPPEKGICTVQNIYLKNITATDSRTAFHVEGFEEQPAEDFIFENVKVHTKNAGTIKYAKDWKKINSKFTYDDSKAPEIIDSSKMADFSDSK
jgi:polygalacturonase